MIRKVFKKAEFLNTNRKKLLQNSFYLKEGTYKYNDSLKYIFLIERKTEERIFSLFENDPLSKRRKKSQLNKLIQLVTRIKIRNKEKSPFKGSIYFLTKDNKEDKIFDLENDRILTIYNSQSHLIKDIKVYNYFKNHFNIPPKKILDKKKIIEPLVPFQDHWSIVEERLIIENLISKYTSYYSSKNFHNNNIITYKKMLNLIHKTEDKTFFLRNILKYSEKIDELEILKFPLMRQHGDLRKNNILYNSSRNEIHIIDWEFSNYYLPFYDIFFLMYHEAVLNDNAVLISSFMQGEFDELFISLFKTCGLNYDEDKKAEYLHLFCVEHFIKKVKQNSKIKKNYSKLFDIINEFIC